MSGLLSVATRALMANQTVLQTTGNNIANVNTAGYSRQSAVMQTVPGQFTGSGYIGKGVDITTIQRNYSVFLTRQSALAGATASGDMARADKLTQLEDIFPGGTNGLGTSINDMLNAFSDVASAPTDLTARTVALTKVNETATRMNSASTSLDELQTSLKLELADKVGTINDLAKSIAAVNDKIARVQGNGQPPNDLLDHRDQLVRDLNKLIQTTSVPADDGTVGIFIGGSQALVLGKSASEVKLVDDDFGDPLKSKLSIVRGGQTLTLDESALGGGEVPSLLKFQNTDLAEGRNLLGRLTLAVTRSMNDQHALGLDLDGNVGGNLFSPVIFDTSNILKPIAPAILNSGTASVGLGISDITKFVASDYEINFTGPAAGTITRRSDGMLTGFSSVPTTIDGLTVSVASGTANAGDRFLLKPFSTAASNIHSEFSTPRALAVASPVAVTANSANTGSLTVASLAAKTSATPINSYRINFTGANTYDIVNVTTSTTVSSAQPYLSGQAITFTPASPAPGWSLTLTGAAKNGDNFTVAAQPAAYRNLNSGNAAAMMSLRDVPMFDGAVLTDGYAGLIARIGVRVQSATYSAEVSSAIAANLEKDRASVSGVNLDEEAAKLLQYQQAYQASAKVIQIAQGIFDTLIQTISR